MHGTVTHRTLQLLALDTLSSRPGDVLPPLYEPELVALGSNAFLFRGFESADGAGYVQEWRCEVV
jgi:hypothetical protein